ncbi:MAG TPA: hypothetical protein VM282_09670 [Acidimicrobiales bacterium]|nr:hypothetical protein [Acidimicrobiales bacterium]
MRSVNATVPSDPVLAHTLEYWRNVDPDLGTRVAKGMRNGG